MKDHNHIDRLKDEDAEGRRRRLARDLGRLLAKAWFRRRAGRSATTGGTDDRTGHAHRRKNRP